MPLVGIPNLRPPPPSLHFTKSPSGSLTWSYSLTTKPQCSSLPWIVFLSRLNRCHEKFYLTVMAPAIWTDQIHRWIPSPLLQNPIYAPSKPLVNSWPIDWKFVCESDCWASTLDGSPLKYKIPIIKHLTAHTIHQTSSSIKSQQTGCLIHNEWTTIEWENGLTLFKVKKTASSWMRRRTGDEKRLSFWPNSSQAPLSPQGPWTRTLSLSCFVQV